MMRLLLTLSIAAGLAGCGVVREAENRAKEAEQKAITEQRTARFNAVVADVEAAYAAKKITFGQMVSRAAEARMAINPNDPLIAEEVYFAQLQGSRVDKGEISIAEYRSTLAEKLSDIAAKRQLRATQAVTAMAAINASRPRSVYCTSNKVGDFTYTNCN